MTFCMAGSMKMRVVPGTLVRGSAFLPELTTKTPMQGHVYLLLFLMCGNKGKKVVDGEFMF
jgi:hypothetical protein